MYAKTENAIPIIPHKDRNAIVHIISKTGFSFPLTLRLFNLKENIGISETISKDRAMI